MYRCLPDFGQSFNYVYDQKSTEGIFIFHGFPSQKNRNKDLAAFLSKNTKASIFVHHYEGIGESLGKFYFEHSVLNAFKYVEKIIKDFQLTRIHFLGHSWGGFVSLNLLSSYINQLASVVLFSPFTQIPEGRGIDDLADSLMKEYPHLFFHRTHNDVCLEFKNMLVRFDYTQKMKLVQWQGPTLILQALNDAATPEARTRAILPLLGSQVTYKELKIDHSFTEKRDETFSLTKDFYKNIHLAK